MFSMHGDNLAKLPAYLDTLPADYAGFDMRDFARAADEDDRFIPLTTLAATDCGTVCCALGDGPAAGIVPFPGEGWCAEWDRVQPTTG
jgi:hypothetical protein